jgi:pSer/pThr/pTyr-binding forkhead associated (FHA) protein
MAARITLTVAIGRVDGPDYVFEAPTRCVVGRASDCDIRLSFVLMDVSRRHCAFEIDPPAVRVRDLGSRYGTFVNGQRLRERTGQPKPDPRRLLPSEDKELTDGDEVRLGHVVVRVSISAMADEPDGLALACSSSRCAQDLACFGPTTEYR